MSELDQKKCDVCGKSIPVWAPAGNCPACLMETTLGVSKAVETETPAKEKVGDLALFNRAKLILQVKQACGEHGQRIERDVWIEAFLDGKSQVFDKLLSVFGFLG